MMAVGDSPGSDGNFMNHTEITSEGQEFKLRRLSFYKGRLKKEYRIPQLNSPLGFNGASRRQDTELEKGIMEYWNDGWERRGPRLNRLHNIQRGRQKTEDGEQKSENSGDALKLQLHRLAQPPMPLGFGGQGDRRGAG